jgi:LysM repeat protein
LGIKVQGLDFKAQQPCQQRNKLERLPEKIITLVQYNLSMRKMVLICILILVACAPQAPNGTRVPKTLQPYQTIKPSVSPSEPAGLVVTIETPIPSPTPFLYKVKSGDTLSQIAEKFNVSLDALLEVNPQVDPNGMSVGTTLKIPSNPKNPTGEATPTPVPFPVEQIACHPTLDRGLWCFVLVRNDSSDLMENITAQVTLLDAKGQSLASQTALLPLDILPPDGSLPLSVFFAPDVPPDARPQVQILTAIRLLPGDERYLPATIQNSLVKVDWSGSSAQVNGQVHLPAESKPAGEIWVAAVAYDGAGNVVGLRRWESSSGLQPGGNIPFSFMVSSIAGSIERVDFAVEARP